MRVGWLVDDPTSAGGAELTQAEFRAAAPDDVEIVDCPAGGIDITCDRFVIHNCMQYTLDELQQILRVRRVVKFWHDVGSWLQPDVRTWLDANATHICCSPIQAEHMGFGYKMADHEYMGDRGIKASAALIPPPVDLSRFAAAAASSNGSRSGAVCVGSWRNYGKAPHKAAEWAAGNGGIDFYGGGPMAPAGAREIAYEGMPKLLARYKTLVFLPTVLEPFGRVVAEGWAAGCTVVTNGLVGARYWIEENPGAIETAAEDFWELVLA